MMQTPEMLKVFLPHRGNAIVWPGHAGKEWFRISTQPRLDLALSPPPPMGGQASFACALALAQPDRKVVLFDSEGNLVMNLGALATVAEQAPKNFYHFVMDNECYATTGGQPVPNAKNIAYDAIARGAGYPRVFAFDKLDDFAAHIEEIMAGPGPVFVALKVAPEIDNKPVSQKGGWQPRKPDQILQDLRSELGVAN